jgi:hypothetical protein
MPLVVASGVCHKDCHNTPRELTEPTAALVRAIRRVIRPAAAGDDLNGGVVMFRVKDVFAFARRLVEQGVTVRGEHSR